MLGDHEHAHLMRHNGMQAHPMLILQLSWALGQQDRRWFCERSYQKVLAKGKVEMFFYDTCPFVRRYYQTTWATNIGRYLLEAWRMATALLNRMCEP